MSHCSEYLQNLDQSKMSLPGPVFFKCVFHFFFDVVHTETTPIKKKTNRIMQIVNRKL